MDPKRLRETVGIRLLAALGVSLIALGAFLALVYRLNVFAVIPVVLAAAVIVVVAATRVGPPR
jgi:hypothetical protein